MIDVRVDDLLCSVTEYSVTLVEEWTLILAFLVCPVKDNESLYV